MLSPELARLQERLEEAREQWKISDQIQADAKRQYEEARRRRQAIFARIRAEEERRNQPLLKRLREAIFG